MSQKKTIPRPPAIEPQPAFGEKLRAWREAIGWSLDEMALISGISRIQLHRWENPAKHPGNAPVLNAARRYNQFRNGDITSALEGRIAELAGLLEELRGTTLSDS